MAEYLKAERAYVTMRGELYAYKRYVMLGIGYGKDRTPASTASRFVPPAGCGRAVVVFRIPTCVEGNGATCFRIQEGLDHWGITKMVNWPTPACVLNPRVSGALVDCSFVCNILLCLAPS